MSRPRRSILSSIFLAAFCLSASSLSLLAQEGPPQCEPAMLDIQVLPLVPGTTPAAASLLIVEFRNRSQTACRLRFEGGLDPAPDPNNTPGFGGDFLESPSGIPLAQRAQLNPGELAHIILAWSGKPIGNGGCYDFDSLHLTIDNKPWLVVFHLWAHVCNRVYQSRVRLGPYTPGEPVSDEWARQSQLQMTDFRPPISPVPQDAVTIGGQPEASLYTFFDHAMLGTYFHVLLNLPRQALPGCPFQVMRRRYADGDTAAYLSRCDTKIGDPKVIIGYAGQTETRTILHIPGFGLYPTKLGPVEFDTTSLVLRDGAPVFVRAHAQFAIKDPTPPELPAIESTLPPCKAEQLAFTRLPTLQDGKWHRADVYQATNTSEQTCLLGGVPQLQKGLDNGFVRPCPNCADSLFQPRPNGWIDLKPHDSAHFLMGASSINTDVERWYAKCDETPALELSLPGNDRVVSLPFNAMACGEINTSAWRAGPYDRDPMNFQFDRQSGISSLNTTQSRCADAPLPPNARSVVLSTRDNLAFCISIGRDQFMKGEPVPVTVWAGNQTDVVQNATSCGTFWSWTVDIYDFYGHRVLSRADQEALKKRTVGEVSIYNDVLPVCSRNVLMSIPPHTWVRVNNLSLSALFGLPPGRYFIVEKPAPLRDSQGVLTFSRPGFSASTPRLTVSIERQ